MSQLKQLRQGMSADELNEAKIHNARILADAAAIAYEERDKGIGEFHARRGLTAVFFSAKVDKRDSQAYVASDDENIVVAFRGSEAPDKIAGLKDWITTDADLILSRPKGLFEKVFLAGDPTALYHPGFLGAVSDIWPKIQPKVVQLLNESKRTIWFTGHSLGGAIASLAGWLGVHEGWDNCHVMTFGAPKVTNKAGADAIDKKLVLRFTRYVNENDPVPHLPVHVSIGTEYEHIGHERVLKPKASSKPDFTSKFLQDLRDKLDHFAIGHSLVTYQDNMRGLTS